MIKKNSFLKPGAIIAVDEYGRGELGGYGIKRAEVIEVDPKCRKVHVGYYGSNVDTKEAVLVRGRLGSNSDRDAWFLDAAGEPLKGFVLVKKEPKFSLGASVPNDVVLVKKALVRGLWEDHVVLEKKNADNEEKREIFTKKIQNWNKRALEIINEELVKRDLAEADLASNTAIIVKIADLAEILHLEIGDEPKFPY